MIRLDNTLAEYLAKRGTTSASDLASTKMHDDVMRYLSSEPLYGRTKRSVQDRLIEASRGDIQAILQAALIEQQQRQSSGSGSRLNQAESSAESKSVAASPSKAAAVPINSKRASDLLAMVEASRSKAAVSMAPVARPTAKAKAVVPVSIAKDATSNTVGEEERSPLISAQPYQPDAEAIIPAVDTETQPVPSAANDKQQETEITAETEMDVDVKSSRAVSGDEAEGDSSDLSDVEDEGVALGRPALPRALTPMSSSSLSDLSEDEDQPPASLATKRPRKRR